MAADLEKIKTSLLTTAKIVAVAVSLAGGFFGIINKLDKLESKIDAINLLTDKDKENLEKRMASLEADFREGKEKVNKDLTQMTNRIFQIYGVLPKQIKLEDDK